MANPTSLRRPGLIVYLSGVGTSCLVLWLVEIINNQGENIMGWYANGIIPAGALLVGIASGVGYAIGARVLNVKLSKAFVLGMLTTGLFDYLAAQWITYLNVLERFNASSDNYSFGSYLRDICENMSFQRSGSKEAGSPLGAFGYVFKGLEMLGFSFGTMIPCAILRGMPYCMGCQRYLKKNATARLFSAVLTTAIKQLPRKERASAVQKAVEEINTRGLALLQKVSTLPLDATLAALKEASEEPIEKSTARIQIRLSKCPECDAHHIATELHVINEKGKPGQGSLPALDKTKLPATTENAAPA